MARLRRLFSLLFLARGTTRIPAALFALVLLSISAATGAARGSSSGNAERGSTLTPRYGDATEAYVGKWGPYTIRIDVKNLFIGKLRITDEHGKTVLGIKNFSVVTNMESLHLGGATVLRIDTENDNEFQNQRDVWLEQTRRGLRIDLILAGGNAAPTCQYLHGRPLLLSSDSATLEWISDFCHACTPRYLPVVLAWNGYRYVIATRRYPYFTKMAARQYQYQLIKCVHFQDLDDYNGLHTAIAGYYGNMVELGEGAYASRWIMRHVPESTKSWFRGDQTEIRRKVLHSCVMATAPRSRVLNFGWLAGSGKRPADTSKNDCGCRIR